MNHASSSSSSSPATSSYSFRLYIAGRTANSMHALANLDALCRKHLEGDYEVELVDVFEDPGRALDDGIFMTPTLVKLGPDRPLRIVGTLANAEAVLHALGVSGDPT